MLDEHPRKPVQTALLLQKAVVNDLAPLHLFPCMEGNPSNEPAKPKGGNACFRQASAAFCDCSPAQTIRVNLRFTNTRARAARETCSLLSAVLVNFYHRWTFTIFVHSHNSSAIFAKYPFNNATRKAEEATIANIYSRHQLGITHHKATNNKHNFAAAIAAQLMLVDGG